MAISNLPGHVAIIMDGNGRWAEKHGLTREKGHIYGANKVPEIAKHLFLRGVKTVTLYAFSEENFSRPETEVRGIFKRIEEFVSAFPAAFERGKVRLKFSGDLEKIGEDLRRACLSAETETKGNYPFTLNILLNYGGRTEIIRAARLLCGQEITEENLRSKLYSYDLPDPDLIIRTGGEKRLSGFMPFQSAYAELYFSDVLFPDFSAEDIDTALEDYALRERRYGGLK